MTEESSLEFRLRKVYGRTNYIVVEIKHDLKSEKYNNTCKYFKSVEHLLLLLPKLLVAFQFLRLLH